MRKVSRRALVAGIGLGAAQGLGGASAANATQPSKVVLRGTVSWFNRARALLAFDPENAAAPRLLVELPRVTAITASLDAQVHARGPVSVIVAPSPDGLSPWGVHHLVTNDGEEVVLQARVRSLTWPGRGTTPLILQVVAAHFGVSVASILAYGRAFPIVRARQTAMYLMHKLEGHTTHEIGQRVGGRDDTTVLHAIRKIAHQVAENANARDNIKRLTDQITRVGSNLGVS